MILLGCKTAPKNEQEVKTIDSQIDTMIMVLPSCPVRRVKELTPPYTIQKLTEYIKYQDNYITDLEDYALTASNVVALVKQKRYTDKHQEEMK